MLGDITIDGGAHIDLNQYIQDYKTNAIKLFTNEELKEELQKRENGKSKHETYIEQLDLYKYVPVEVDVYDVLNEVDNDDLLSEMSERHLSSVELVEPSTPREVKQLVCWSLGINEFWTDEEIFEKLKKQWSYI